MTTHGAVWLEELAERIKDHVAQGLAPPTERLTIRDFLDKFHIKRRTPDQKAFIRRLLRRNELQTAPDFAQFDVDLDTYIVVQHNMDLSQLLAHSGHDNDPTIRLDSLVADDKKLESIAPDIPLSNATTTMAIRSLSQLPVMINEREVKGSISWESIGRRRQQGHDDEYVRQSMDNAVPIIADDTPILDSAEFVVKHGYVLVKGQDNKILDIITAVDLLQEMARLSRAYLIVGEIEGHLRRVTRGAFTAEQLKRARFSQRDEDEAIGPDDLTLSEYCTLLASDDNWKGLGLTANQQVFIKNLDWIRQRRNHIMHFNLHRLSPGDVEMLSDIVRFFRGIKK